MSTLLKVISIVDLILGTVLIVTAFYHAQVIKRAFSTGKAALRFLQVILPGIMLVCTGIIGVELYPTLHTYDIPTIIMPTVYAASIVFLFLGILVFYDHYILIEKIDPEPELEDAYEDDYEDDEEVDIEIIDEME